MLTFIEKQKLYAELLVTVGLNIQADQVLNISAEACSRDFAILVAEAAYERGAKFVNIDFIDQRLLRARVLLSKEEQLSYVPPYLGAKYRDLVDSTAANLRLIGSEVPEILADLDPKRLNSIRLNQHLAIKYFYDEGIGKSKVHWTVAAAATEGWAKRLFPTDAPQTGLSRLWDEIFRICRADSPDCIELWRAHDEILHARAAHLNALEIETIHFQGPGTDLSVGLSPRAKFKGGSDLSPRGVPFEPNIPTEEVFTTPDYRKTNGHVRATRPFLINGKLIQGLRLEFKDGLISAFDATEGSETFKEYISSDEGAKRLGEVALVGIDSPVYKSGLVFEEILFDENAACHIAVGSAYKFCIEGANSLSKEELNEIGCNESTVHTDMMISDQETFVEAQCRDGSRIVLLERGAWAI